MKKTLIALLAASVASVLQVSAITVNVSTLSGYNAGQGGGEFNINPVIGVGYSPLVAFGGGFETFCLSRDVGIIVPGSYDATVSASGTYVKNYSGGTQVLSRGTAYLYSQFALGTLSGYNYTGTAGGNASARGQSAYQLQLAIWTLEGQYDYGSLANDLLNPFVAAAANFWGGGIAGLQLAMQAGAGFGVGALNLTFLANNQAGVPAGYPAQSMLTLLPDGGTTLMLMGIGFSSLALVSRKFRA